MYVDFNILNQLGSPAFNSNTLANRPAAGYRGRLFVSTDTFALYRDNGTGWDLIGGPGTGTVTGSGVPTAVAFWDGTSSLSSNTNLYWDNTNSRLGIGTSTPGTKLDIHGAGTIAHLNGTGTNSSYLAFQQAGTSQYSVGYDYNAGTRQHFRIYDNVGAKNVLGILQSSRFVGINYQFTGASDVPRYTFDVFGNSGVTGDFHSGSSVGNGAEFFAESANKHIYTKLNGSTLGIDLDFTTQEFWVGDSVSGWGLDIQGQTGLMRFGDFANNFGGYNANFIVDASGDQIYTSFVNSNTGFSVNCSAGEIYASLGDFGLISNGTYLQIDNGSQVIQTYNEGTAGNYVGLYLDFASNNFRFQNSNYQLQIAPTDTGWYVKTLGDYNGFVINWQNANQGNITNVYLGDFFGQTNSTQLQINVQNDYFYFYSQSGKYQYNAVSTFATNAAAISGGLTAGMIYRQTGTDFLCIVH